VGGNLPGFYGKYYYTLDTKGRTLIPPPFKEILSSNYSMKLVFVNEAFDRCLCAYPVEEWNNHLEEVKKWPETLKEVRYYMLKVVGSAVECEIDKQGRVLIPSALRADAGLNDEVVVIGQGHIIQVWDRKEFDKALDSSKVDEGAYRERIASFKNK
jgi:MraZ protein